MNASAKTFGRESKSTPDLRFNKSEKLYAQALEIPESVLAIQSQDAYPSGSPMAGIARVAAFGQGSVVLKAGRFGK